MRLATLDASAQPGKRDGMLVVVSPDGGHFAPAPVKTLQEALENWAAVAPSLAGSAIFPSRSIRRAWPRLCRARGNGSMDRPLPAMAN
jgi:hypothetical protein